MTKLEKIETRDGSITFYNPEYGDNYHSHSVGAIEEAIVKYVEPANIKDGDTVLDFCFGLGYNSLATLMKLKQINIVGLEKEQEIIDEIKNMKVPDEFLEKYETIRNVARDGKFDKDGVKIELIMGDAAKTIKQLNRKFDAVLFDPFSPGKCPELWSLEVFKDVAKVMKVGARLTTYSCARWVRDNLREAGFEVVDGPIFGRKSASTIGIKK